MSAYDKRRIVRLYSEGRNFYITSQAMPDEVLLVKAADGGICMNRISDKEWTHIRASKTNTIRSSSISLINDFFGCLGILSVSAAAPIGSSVSPSASFALGGSTGNLQQQMSETMSQKEDTMPGVNMQHYLLFVKDATRVNSYRKCEIMRITDVLMYSLSGDELSPNAASLNVQQPQQMQQQMSVTSNPNLNNVAISFATYLNELRKFLSSGTFYFSYSADRAYSFDLTLSSQARHSSHNPMQRFLWNHNLHIPFRRLGVDVDTWLLKVINGCVEIKDVILGHRQFKCALFSRQSCERVGTRFSCRGCNDDGHVANFVETEQVVHCETGEETSYVQLRGSVPVFFEQTGIQVGTHRIRLTRSHEACYPAFERHMQSLMQQTYGTKCFALNLLGIKGDESVLTRCYQEMCGMCPLRKNGQLQYLAFDYHSEMKANKQALSDVMWPKVCRLFYYDTESNRLDTRGMFFSIKKNDDDDNDQAEPQVRFQSKVIRTNCMDCLDRTNSVQSFVGIELLRAQLGITFGIESELELNKFRNAFRQMWIINGDSISRIYAGTGAIQGKSGIQDIHRSLTRAIQSNFLDTAKQDAMDLLFYGVSRSYGDLADRIRTLMPQSCLQLPSPLVRELVSKYRLYTEPARCKIAVGTWNINGGLDRTDMDCLNLKDWLVDGHINAKLDPRNGFIDWNYFADESTSDSIDVDVFVVGFEEIVDLSAQNIISASDENAQQWQDKIQRFLSKHGDYVSVLQDSLQLVGVCLFVFVHRRHLHAIRDLAVAKTKTGLGGAAGNKGGVLIRFVFYNTSMCFVCSHFAAHQKEIAQRNEDFRQIYENSEFAGAGGAGQVRLEARLHDYVVWCGDLNYRIDMANDMCRAFIENNELEQLLGKEQLTIERREKRVFREFQEAKLLFPPTYKYNLGEDSYDRSEKCRVPAWTDRILWRRRAITRQDMNDPHFDYGRCLYYGRAGSIRLSDHRPVAALLDVEVCLFVPKKFMDVFEKLLRTCRGACLFQATLVVTTHNNYMDQYLKEAIYKLFYEFAPFTLFREYQNVLYFTYADWLRGYDAMAHFNNYNMDDEYTLQVRVESDNLYSSLLQLELNDCMRSIQASVATSISAFSRNPYFVSTSPQAVGELLGPHVPSKLHANVSIGKHMDTFTSLVDVVDEQGGTLLALPHMHHQHHTLANKSLSNSNLTMLEQQEAQPIVRRAADAVAHAVPGPHHRKNVQSAVNLLDLSPEPPQRREQSVHVTAMPKRPPPPSKPPPPPPLATGVLLESTIRPPPPPPPASSAAAAATATRPVSAVAAPVSSSSSSSSPFWDEPASAWNDPIKQSQALWGDEPAAPPAKPPAAATTFQSLFGDEPPKPAQQSSLFDADFNSLFTAKQPPTAPAPAPVKFTLDNDPFNMLPMQQQLTTKPPPVPPMPPALPPMPAVKQATPPALPQPVVPQRPSPFGLDTTPPPPNRPPPQHNPFADVVTPPPPNRPPPQSLNLFDVDVTPPPPNRPPPQSGQPPPPLPPPLPPRK